jgi:hypothetical protein
VTSSPSVARSAARPRVYRYPPYRYSHGDDAIDQAELAGLYLDEWQQDVLRHALGEREDGKWSAFEAGLVVGRQQGKGAILEARALAGFLLFDEPLILWSAHEYRTALEMFRRLRSCVRRLGRRVNDNLYDFDGIPIKVNNTNGEEGFERLDTEQRIQLIARSKNAGRGFTADCLIWDEAYALVEDQVDAQMPTLLARPNAQIWYASSPPLDAVSGAQLFRVRRRAGGGGQDGLAYFEWGAEGSLDKLGKVNLDDRAVWAQVLPAYGGRVSEEGVQRLRDAMSDNGFAREVLCIWPPDLGEGFRVIPDIDWRAAADPRPYPPVLPVAFGVEVSWDREWASIGVAWKRADGMRQIELTRDRDGALDHRPGVGWIVGRAKELVEAWNPCAFVVPSGPAWSLVDELEAAGIEVTPMNTTEQAQGFAMLYDGITGKDIAARDVRHGNQPQVNTAVAGAVKRMLGDASVWERKASVGFSPLGGVTGALWGYTTKAPEWSGDYDVLDSVY